MNWPLASDYQDAIQNPAYCFQDPDLKAGQPVVTKLGLPRVASGTFASVYEMRHGAQRWAVRCFLRPSADQQARYSLLSQYLSSHSLPGIVDFAYEVQGIRIRGQWYPIVKMEWIEGTTLHTYVGSHVREAATLRKLAAQWRGLIANLRLCQIAHADLQHGNVLVTPGGALRLVDYDGMFIPALRGQPSHELGHTNYQHPQRVATDYNANLDNFAAIVIYTSLVALTYDPTLWTQFHTGENLIFSAADFKAPQKSAVFERLYRSSEALVRELSQRLALACEGPVWRVPDFLEVLAEFPDIPEPKPWWQDTTTPATPAKPAQQPAATASTKTVSTVAAKTPLPRTLVHGEESEAEAPLPEWLKSEKQTQSMSRSPKLVAGFLLPLARLWRETNIVKSQSRPLTVSQTTSPTSAIAVPFPQPVPTHPEAHQSGLPAKNRRSHWRTFSSLSCLLLCLAFYGTVMLGSFLLHTVLAAFSDSDSTGAKITATKKPTAPTLPTTSTSSTKR